MAIEWQQTLGSVVYQLRTAGASKRLYSNGVLHTQYNPSKPFSGGVWDLLSFSAMVQPKPYLNVLLLGVGGGAVVGQIKQLLPQANIIGIDLDPRHLLLAKTEFGIKGEGICLLEADAEQWLKYYKGPKFDLIIDDLFGHNDGEALRAFELDEYWSSQLLRHLHDDGVLAVNFECHKQRLASSLYRQAHFKQRFSCRYSLGLPAYENCIGIWSGLHQDIDSWLHNIQVYSGMSIESIKRLGGFYIQA